MFSLWERGSPKELITKQKSLRVNPTFDSKLQLLLSRWWDRESGSTEDGWALT